MFLPLRKHTFALAILLSASLLASRAAQAEPQKQRVEVVFVLDTTGSMASLIDGAKRKIWNIANAIVDSNPNADIYMGLVGYRDIGDKYVTREYELTTDIQDIYAKLLSFKADGGGDTPESVNEALDVAVTKMGWSKPAQQDARRVLFLVGDAPPHMDYKQDRKYPEILKEALQRGIIVNAVQAGAMESTTKVWKEIAKLGKGDFLQIPQDGGRVVVIKTPYDEEISEIQIRINKTIVPYGAVKQQDMVREKMEMAASPMISTESKADMSRYIAKAGDSKDAITGDGDLVGAVAAKPDALSAIPEKELPKIMQTMKPAEREAYLAEQQKERATLHTQLMEKINQRDAYIQEETAKQSSEKATPDSFDSSVLKTLEKQLK